MEVVINAKERAYMAARISAELLCRYPDEMMLEKDTLEGVAKRSLQYVDALCNAFAPENALVPSQSVDLSDKEQVFIAAYFVTNVISRSFDPIASPEYIGKLARRGRTVAACIGQHFKSEASK